MLILSADGQSFEWSDLPEDITLAPPDLPFLREGPTIELKRPNAPGIPGLPDFDPPSVPSEYAQYIPLLICPVFAGFFAGQDSIIHGTTLPNLLNNVSAITVPCGWFRK